jgi:hypothetical protein
MGSLKLAGRLSPSRWIPYSTPEKDCAEHIAVCLLALSPSYTDTMFGFAEQLSKEPVGHELKQILLLHANQLEADHVGELAEVQEHTYGDAGVLGVA